jgi:hypothetical protein
MNDDARDKEAVAYRLRRLETSSWEGHEKEIEAAFRAGWNACYAAMTTKRSEPEPDWFGKEQTRDCDLT